MAERGESTFRLIDLLVGLFVLGVLAALLLPASISREATPRTQCANNLRQSGLALQTFENAKGRLPGYLNRVGSQPASWVVPVLPYLERMDLWEAWQGHNRPVPEPLVVRLNWFACPSDEHNDELLTPLSYIVNSGIPDKLPPGSGTADKLANGVFHNRFDSQSAPAMTMAFLNAHDGASHTLLLAENVQAGQWAGNGQYARLPSGDPIVAPNGFFTPEQAERLTTLVWHRAQAQPTTAVPERQINVGHDRDLDEAPTIDFARPSSFHAGGANVALADGSVRFLAEKIDYGVYVAVMTPDGANSDAPDVPITEDATQSWRTSDTQALDRLLGLQ